MRTKLADRLVWVAAVVVLSLDGVSVSAEPSHASALREYVASIAEGRDAELTAFEDPEAVLATGAWLRTYGESTRDVVPGPFDPLDWGVCTMRAREGGARLYLHVFDWPKTGTLVLPGLSNRIEEVKNLADGSNVAYEPGVGAVELRLGASEPTDELVSVLAIDIEGDPKVYRTPTFTRETTLFIERASIELVSPQGLTLRYTTDGSEPTSESPEYEEPIEVVSSTTITARAFVDDVPVSGRAKSRFTRVSPRPSIPLDPETQGLRCEIYKDEWVERPNLDEIAPRWTVLTPGVALSPSPMTPVARRFIGFIEVDEDALYTFLLEADDFASLSISGREIVTAEGSRLGDSEKGYIALSKGYHRFKLDWFNLSGARHVRLQYGELGDPLRTPIKQDFTP